MKPLFHFLTLFVLFLIVAFQGNISAQQIAFPGAEGYGKYTSGGRGGRVVEVTTLKDLDAQGKIIPGSFRAALKTEGTDPITIVFRVSGVISLSTSEIRSNRPNMTIAGQTAPGDGICIRGGTINLSGSKNVIVRYMRFRPGDEKNAEVSALRFENSENFIVDHCSMSWAIEETTHFSSSKFLSVQWCIISESLYNSIHKKGARGYAAQWGGQYASYHHNLLAHHHSRMPRINGSNKNDIEALVDYRNNVNFNWGVPGAFYGGEWESQTEDCKGFTHTNIVNNYFKPGPATSDSIFFIEPYLNRPGRKFCGYGKWFLSGNVMEGHPDLTLDNWSGIQVSKVGSVANIRSNTEFDYHEVGTEKAGSAFQSVLTYAGATKPKRDKIDARVIGEVKGTVPIIRSVYEKNGVKTPVAGTTVGLIDSQNNLRPKNAPADWNAWDAIYISIDDSTKAPLDSDHDGMPDVWEKKNKLNPNDPKDGASKGKDGFTNLEKYLNQLADTPYLSNGKRYKTIRLNYSAKKSMTADL